MPIKIEKNKKDYIEIVFDLLKRNLSNFKPQKKSYNKLWLNYKKKGNFYSVIALLNKKIIGYGSVIIYSTIRGGKLGYIEDIVVDKI